MNHDDTLTMIRQILDSDEVLVKPTVIVLPAGYDSEDIPLVIGGNLPDIIGRMAEIATEDEQHAGHIEADGLLCSALLVLAKLGGPDTEQQAAQLIAHFHTVKKWYA